MLLRWVRDYWLLVHREGSGSEFVRGGGASDSKFDNQMFFKFGRDEMRYG
jgi:hypothetical protein